MNLSFYIAKRYLFTKKSHNVINLISGVSVCGVALATMALICTLSVFNGFSGLVSGLFTHFDPQLKITAKKGKVFNVEGEAWDRVRTLPQIDRFCETIEDNAMAQYKGNQVVVTIKGVDDRFDELTDIKSILVGEGEYRLNDDAVDFGIMGIQLFQTLGCGLYFTDPLEVYVPKRNVKINLANPTANFNKAYLYSPGIGFMVKQEKYDCSYILTSIRFARELFGYTDSQAQAVELKLTDKANLYSTKREIKSILGDGYHVEDRYEQQKDVFKVMRIEKLISYLFLTFILMIACFNVIGSLSMLILDKKRDVVTLRNMGANGKLISRIFLLEGTIISLLGAFIGLVLGIILCFVQKQFGIIAFGDSTGSFIVDAYPVSLSIADVAIVFVTVIFVSFISLWIPVVQLTKKIL